MICFNCKKQVPDNAQTCPSCGAPLVHQTQIVKEIGVRRYQRWIFYAVISIIFLGMTGGMIKIYTDYASAITKINATQTALDKAQADLTKVQGDLGTASKSLTDTQGQLSQKQSQIDQLTQAQQGMADSQKTLQQKIDEFTKTVGDQTTQLQKYQQFNLDLGPANAAVYSELLGLSTKMSNADLLKIQVADYNFVGTDTDKDGLPDILEDSFGSNKSNANTNGDMKYTDKQEVINGYSPVTIGKKLPLDINFANANKGKFLIQSESKGQVWYVSPVNGKRYFFGVPTDAINAIKKLGL